MNYSELYKQSLTHKESFWAEQAKQIHWFREPSHILTQNEKGFYRWFVDGEMNTCFCCLDYHILSGRGDQAALIYDSPVTKTIQRYTYSQLKENVEAFACGLQNLGITKGDTVVIYMPVIPQAAIAMLACARIGAIHSVVFGGFAPHELALRINDARPKALISASYGIEFDKII